MTPKRSRSWPASGAQADGPSGWRTSAPSDEAVPVAGELVGVGAVHVDVERVRALVVGLAGPHVERHHPQARVGRHLAEDDLVGPRRVVGRAHLAVRHRRHRTAEDGGVEVERGAGVAVEVEVGGGLDGHGVSSARAAPAAASGPSLSGFRSDRVRFFAENGRHVQPVLPHARAAVPAAGAPRLAGRPARRAARRSAPGRSGVTSTASASSATAWTRCGAPPAATGWPPAPTCRRCSSTTTRPSRSRWPSRSRRRPGPTSPSRRRGPSRRSARSCPRGCGTGSTPWAP